MNLPYQQSTSYVGITKSSHDHRDEGKIGEINQIWRIWLKSRFWIGGRTSPVKPYWNPVEWPDMSGVQNRIVQFAKSDTLILTGLVHQIVRE
jgi:hypothetical protein